MNNKQRILTTSRDLMNQQGSQAVGTHHICDALGISPGNLYYHFKNKERIILSIFHELETEFRAAFEVDSISPITPKAFAGYYLRTLDVAFGYRFFFRDLLYLLRRDDKLAEQYRALQLWALERLESIAAQVTREGHLQIPKSRPRYRSIAMNTWLIWSNWVSHIEISNGHNRITRADMVRGIEQIFDVLSGNLDKSFEKQVRQHLVRATRARN